MPHGEDRVGEVRLGGLPCPPYTIRMAPQLPENFFEEMREVADPLQRFRGDERESEREAPEATGSPAQVPPPRRLAPLVFNDGLPQVLDRLSWLAKRRRTRS